MRNEKAKLQIDKVAVLKEIQELHKNLHVHSTELNKLSLRKRELYAQKVELERNIGFEPQNINIYENEIQESQTKKQAISEEINVSIIYY